MTFKKRFSLLCCFLCIQYSIACTGITIKTENGAILPARTLEFGFDIQSDILVIPKGTQITFLSSLEGKDGYKMTAKYGFAGMNAVGKEIVIDGINEAGLYLGSFYFSGYAVYDSLTAQNQSKAVSSEEMGNFILGSFASVDEVIQGLENVSIVGTYIEAIQGQAPLHYAVTDKSGKSIVIEYTKTGLKIFDNSVGVVTNNPTYDWHLTNLSNYINLTPENLKGVEINGNKYGPLSEGTGMLGLPGDFTSTSRFVRATAFVNTALPCVDEEEGVFRAFHILNAFDIPIGVVEQQEKSVTLAEYTVWTSVADTRSSIYYFKTYKNQSVMKVDLKEVLAKTNGKPMTISSEIPRKYITLTTNE